MKATAKAVGIRYASPTRTLFISTLLLNSPQDTLNLERQQPSGKLCTIRRNLEQ
jgi:hypothetical protein